MLLDDGLFQKKLTHSRIMKMQVLFIVSFVFVALMGQIGFVKENNREKIEKEHELRMQASPWVETLFETQVVSTTHFRVILPLKGTFDCFRFEDVKGNTFVHEVSVLSDEYTMNSHDDFIRAVENHPTIKIRCIFKEEDPSKKKYIVEIKNTAEETLWTSTALQDFLSRK